MQEKIDLHTHTYYSDGLIEPENLLKLAKKKNLKLVSITDHNTLAPYRHFDWEDEKTVTVIPGCEFSANYLGKRVHILGYGVDTKNPVLAKYLKTIRKTQLKKLEMYMQFFDDFGVYLPSHFLNNVFEKEYSASDTGLMRMLFQENIKFPRKYFLDAKAEAARVFPFVEMTSKEIIDLIHLAGGKAVLAHPIKYRYKNIDYFFACLKKEGLDGVECFHPNHPSKTKEYYCRMAQKNNLFITAGSDAHTYYDNKANKREFASQGGSLKKYQQNNIEEYLR